MVTENIYLLLQANITHSSQDTSSDEEEEQIEVQEVPYETSSDPAYDLHLSEADNSLVEGDDYDVIQVYAVHPDLDLEASSDDDDQPIEDFAVPDKVEATEIDYVHPDDTHNYAQHNYDSHRTTDILQDSLNIDLDTPVVSNVDEYFIKVDNKNILEVKDEPVVKDVDEYFIKDMKEEPQIPNVDDFFIKHKVPEEESTRFHIAKPVANVEPLFPTEVKKNVKEDELENDQNAEVINESDLEVLPNIEDLKRFLLEDMTYSKLKSAQRSLSVPHSPMNILDIDDAKTCLSFEDLNLDLSDLAFDNDKDKSDTSANKSDDIPRTLTEEDVNSFLITSKPKSEPITEDDFSPQDMEIDRPVESSINSIQPSILVSPVKVETPIKPVRKSIANSTPIAKPTVLDFCVEKTTVKKEVADIKIEADDFVDVESCNDTVIPVLEANNLNSLLEQFEATEKLNTKKKPVVKTEEPKVKSSTKNSLTNGMRLQDAGVQLNKNKMRHILVSIGLLMCSLIS